ncbi:MAG: 4Fe-4S binding protein [Acidobacteriota bacterium]
MRETRAGPVALQVITLGVMSWLAISGMNIGAGMKADELMVLRKTNITTLVVWGLWWPGMIAAALAFGRAWCTVCPMELANRLGDSLARRAGWPRARLGRFLRAGWMTVAVYLVMQLLVAGVSVQSPLRTFLHRAQAPVRLAPGAARPCPHPLLLRGR